MLHVRPPGPGSRTGARPSRRALALRMVIVLCGAVLLTTSCGGDDPADGPDGGETSGGKGQDTNLIGKSCAGNADCTPHGLSCYVTGAGATGICSKGCTTESDCGGGLAHCNSVQGSLICTLPQYCDPCEDDNGCGPDAPVCLKDASGAGYCTKKCTVKEGACPAGALCRSYGEKVDEFACAPASGSCSGDGTQCSPCKTDGDCSPGHSCFQADADAERFCAKGCDAAANTGCDSGFTCESYGGKGVCYKLIDGKGQPTCADGAKGFCDPCAEDWECGSGRCVAKNKKMFCGLPTPCSTNIDCPLGGQATFCVASRNGKGNICAPPPAFNCHGYKACFSHPCGPGETCVDGVCKGT